MIDTNLQALIEEYSRKLGRSTREIDAALKKYPTRPERKIYARKLKDQYDAANAHLEAEHRKREYEQWSIVSQAKHKSEKEEHYSKILQQRKRQPLEVRLGMVLKKARLYDSRTKSPSLGGSGGINSETPLGPPGSFSKQPPTVDLEDSITVIERHLERMEKRIDSFLGLCPPVALTEREKGALLDSLAGMHSKEVSESFSELGSQRTIEKWRKERNPDCSPSTGE